MEEKKLIITPKKFKSDTSTIISARIPSELSEKIEDLARRSNRNKNEMLTLLLTYAVENAQIEGEN